MFMVGISKGERVAVKASGRKRREVRVGSSVGRIVGTVEFGGGG